MTVAHVATAAQLDLHRWEVFLAVNGNGATTAERIRSLGAFAKALQAFRGAK